MSETPHPRDQIAWILALAIAVFTFATHFAKLDDFWLNADEGIYWTIAHADLSQAHSLVTGNAHPPLYYYLLRAMTVFGDGPVPLRVPAAVFGALAVFAAFLLARQVHGSIAGLLAALLFAMAPGIARLAGVARPYMALIAFTMLALWMLVRALRQHERPGRDMAGFAVFGTLALLTHYSSLIVFAALPPTLALMALTRPLTRPQVRALAWAAVPLAVTVALLFFLHIRPHMMGTSMQAQAQTGWLRETFVEGVDHFGRNLLGVCTYLTGPQWSGATLVAGAIGWLACLGGRTTFLALLVPAMLGGAFALSALDLYPIGATRHSVYLAVLIGPVIACGIARLLTQGPFTAVIGVLLFGILGVFHDEVSVWLGVPAKHTAAMRELFIEPDEIEALRGPLAAASEGDGLLLMDTCTASVLAPLLPRERPAPFVIEGQGFGCFRWHDRYVIVARAWNTPTGFESRKRRQHLGKLLKRIGASRPELARARAQGAVFVTASTIPRGGNRQSGPIQSLPPPPPPPLVRWLARGRHKTANFEVFDLDAEGFLAALAALPE